MSEIKHTPWTAVRAPHGPVDVFDSRGYDIVTLYGEDNEQIANLFAAAPELLEVANMFVQYNDADHLNDVSLMLDYADLLKAARAAIAKATCEIK
jgi:hypothetical protein